MRGLTPRIMSVPDQAQDSTHLNGRVHYGCFGVLIRSELARSDVTPDSPRSAKRHPLFQATIASCKIREYNITMARGSIAYPGTGGSAVTATAVDDAVLTASSLLVAVSARSIESVDESITLA